MRIEVRFWSYFADLAGASEITLEMPTGSTVGHAMTAVELRFPALTPARRCALMAVGVDYAHVELVLNDGDELSLFPPVQGG